MNQLELNKQIEALITTKDKRGERFTKADLDFISTYEGSGGQAAKGAKGQGILHEFFTPDYICELMWKLARKHGYTSGSVLEPAAGTGRFIKYANSPDDVTGFEINPFSARIAELTNQKGSKKPTIHTKYFETAFLKAPRNTERLPGFSTWLEAFPFELVIGNPPYGLFKTFYSSFFKRPKMLQIEHFFIYYGLQLLKPGGILCFITGSSLLSKGAKYDPFRKELEKISSLLEAFRLPPVFRFTQVPTDILIFKKR